MRLLNTACAFFMLAFFSMPPVASAFEEDYGGYAATAGALTFGVAAALAQYGGAALLEPSCETCKAGAWNYAGAIGLGALAVGTTIGGAWLGGELASTLKLSPDLGWGLAGAMVGLPTFGTLYLSLPAFEPPWMNASAGILALTGGGVLTGWHFVQVAQGRGNAWAEFAFGEAGMVAGGVIGTLICGNEPCMAVPLSIGLGGLIGVASATAIFGFGDDPNVRSMPLIQAIF